jgi:hypothetical protein
MGKYLISFLLILALTLLTAGCSGDSKNPLNPDVLPGYSTDSGEHQTAGVWILTLDEDNLKLNVEPFRDSSAFHANATWYLMPPYCSDCINAVVTSWSESSRNLIATVTLKNPHSIIAFDVRGIIYISDPGVLLLNPDGWTGLYDISGGETNNPFKTFASDETRRAFIPYAQHQVQMRIHYPEFSYIVFAIDVTIGDNCPEPYLIDNFHQDALFEAMGSSADISLDVHDWQNDVNQVSIACSDITGNPVEYLTHHVDNTWTGTIVNNNAVHSGTYPATVTAKSSNSGTLALDQKCKITVFPESSNFFETEDNDDFKYADFLPLLYDPEDPSWMYTGLYERGEIGDDDWYFIDHQHASLGVALIALNLNSQENLILTLYDASLNLVDECSTSGKIWASVHTPVQPAYAPGLYYIKVSGNASYCNYELAPLVLRLWGDGFTFFETDYNGSAANADEMDLSYDPDTDEANFTGELRSDVDYYRIIIPSDGLLVIHLMDYDCASNEEVYIKILDASQNILDSGKIWYQDGNVCVSSEVTTGTYYIKVDANTFTHRYALEPIFVPDL